VADLPLPILVEFLAKLAVAVGAAEPCAADELDEL
jgi:hypothetical protein